MGILHDVMIRVLGGICLTIAVAGTALAATAAKEPTVLGEFNNWAAYAYKKDGGKVCYIVSQPKTSTPKGLKRDPVFFLVTHRTKDHVKNEVNTIIGYPFKKNSIAKVDIDGKRFDLFTDKDGAWADSSAHDNQVVAAMKAGRKMKVTGTSERGTVTVDTYSLSGVTAAMDKIDAACKE